MPGGPGSPTNVNRVSIQSLPQLLIQTLMYVKCVAKPPRFCSDERIVFLCLPWRLLLSLQPIHDVAHLTDY